MLGVAGLSGCIPVATGDTSTAGRTAEKKLAERVVGAHDGSIVGHLRAAMITVMPSENVAPVVVLAWGSIVPKS